MIPDNITNFLYLADTLPKKYPNFYKKFEKILNESKIDFDLLPGTKDIWAVDYMPIQIRDDHFVQFVYNPDYLQTPEYLKTISDVDSICMKIGISPLKSEIILDGGNVIQSTDKVIMTDKVFMENPGIQKKLLMIKLQNLFETDQLFFLPKDPADFTGHADGMVRFVDDSTILINKYSNQSPEFKTAFYKSLQNAGLQYIEIPYCPDINSDISAKGIYLNYLQMLGIIIIPTFGIKEDEVAVKQFEQIFSGYTLKTIDSNDIAVDGGVLNCISWNIKKNDAQNELRLENFDLESLPWEGNNWYNQL